MKTRVISSGLISFGLITACSQEVPNSANAASAEDRSGSAARSASPDAEIGARVRRIVAGQLHVDAGRVTPGARLIEDLGADSLDIVELCLALEEEFGISIPDSDVGQFLTVGGITRYLGSKAGH